MSDPPVGKGLLVLGLGNLLCGDDGLGVVAVHLLRRRFRVPDDARVLDGGTLGLSLLPHLEQAGDAVLVDAIRDGDTAPGQLVWLEGDEVGPAVAERLSPHQVGVADLLDAARWQGRGPARMQLVGLTPGRLDLEMRLSDDVARALPALVDAVVAAAARWGYHFTPEEIDAQPVAPIPGAGDLLGLYGL